MNRIKIILAICGVLLLGVLSWFYFTASVRAENQAARQELLNYLTQRLEDQQVPVNKIDVQGQDTFTISITLLSTGVDKTSPKDSSYINAVEHEVTLAQRQGYSISEMTIEILSTSKRQSLFWAQLPVKSDIDFTSFIEKDFTLADQQNLKQTIEDELNLYGLTKKELQVSFDENGTTLTLDLSADLEVANIALPRFMPGLQALLAELNAKNDYKITFCKVFLKDNQGELLLRYTLDLQLAHETWWMKDGLTQDWFPHPPEE